jgi:outer membrane receptor for ferrienterochelin and colicin
MSKRYILFLLIFLLGRTFAGTTGKIVGRIFDSDTGEPLISANIVIKGYELGAATDLDGEFIILGVPPGVYTLQAIYIGYSTKEVKNVIVKVDLTTKIDFEMKVEAFEGETVVVIATRPLVQKDATATAAVIGAEELAVAPVETFEDIAQTKAGVNVGPNGALHFRGGRSSEVGYIVDGIPVTDAINGGISLDVSTNAIEELSLITGSFAAEYGQAMSGIVNIVTKQGGSKYSGSFSSQMGDIITSKKNSQYFLSEIEKIDPLNTYELEGQFSGPIIGNKLNFNVSARYFNDAGYLYGKRIHGTKDLERNGVITQTGDGKRIALNSNKKYNFQTKLHYTFSSTINFNFTTIYDNREYQEYNHRRSEVPSGLPTRFNSAIQLIGKMSHNISSKAFYSVVYGYLDKSFKRYLDSDPFSDKYVWDGYSTGQYFYPGGTDNFRQLSDQNQSTLKFDLTSLLFKNHEIKTGLEYKSLKLANHSYYMDVDRKDEPFIDANGNGIYDIGESFTDISLNGYWTEARDDNGNGTPGDIIELAGFTNDKWTRKPTEIAFYLQDKVELQDMVINVGLRVDYFDPDGRVLSDLTDPDINRPLKNENIWRDFGTDGVPNTNDADGSESNGIQDPGESNVTLTDRQEYWYKTVDPTIQLSPRIAFAFPISSEGKLFFSYGHFFQLPPYNFLYQDFNNKVKPGLIQTDMGNSALKPQKTISYEVGIEQQLSSDIAAYLKIYQRDMRNILGQDIVLLPNTDAYAVFVNRAYGRVRGVNFSLVKQFSSRFSATVDYTYQVAEGNESNPSKTRRNYRLQEENLKKIVPLEWDQTHALRINALVSKPGDWLISMIGRFESGYPYTPQDANDIVKIAEENSANKIPIIKVDLNMKKSFKIEVGETDYTFSVYAKVYNLFDRLNENFVWDNTGRATYGLGLFGGEFDANWQRRPDWFSKPREVFVGFELTF